MTGEVIKFLVMYTHFCEQVKQLEAQQNRLDELCNELDELQKNQPQDSDKTTEKQYYKDKEEYLLHEVRFDCEYQLNENEEFHPLDTVGYFEYAVDRCIC